MHPEDPNIANESSKCALIGWEQYSVSCLAKNSKVCAQWLRAVKWVLIRWEQCGGCNWLWATQCDLTVQKLNDVIGWNHVHVLVWVVHLKMAMQTRAADRKRVYPRRRWLTPSRKVVCVYTSGLVMPAISESVASSHSWKPPSSSSRYFFW